MKLLPYMVMLAHGHRRLSHNPILSRDRRSGTAVVNTEQSSPSNPSSQSHVPVHKQLLESHRDRGRKSTLNYIGIN